MALRPMPVVVVSTLTQKGADAGMRALELGAVDCVAKPLINLRVGMTALRDELVAKSRLPLPADLGYEPATLSQASRWCSIRICPPSDGPWRSAPPPAGSRRCSNC